MAEESGPLVGANFTDAQWRAIFGGEPGIVGDVDGSAYNLTLGAGTDDAQLGSTTQDSVAVVGGFMHRIAEDTTQAVTIPASTNAVGRTDIIAVRLDSGTYTSAPGPCRLVRIAGVEGSSARPAMDEAPPGVEDFPLWAVTRKGNGTTAEGLNQAAKVDLRRRTGPNLTVPASEALPVNVPIGTRARRGDAEFVREWAGSAARWADVTARSLIRRVTPTASGTLSGNVNLASVQTIPARPFGDRPYWIRVIGGAVLSCPAPRKGIARTLIDGSAWDYAEAQGGSSATQVSVRVDRPYLVTNPDSTHTVAVRLESPDGAITVLPTGRVFDIELTVAEAF
jgi:hypothetical protein